MTAPKKNRSPNQALGHRPGLRNALVRVKGASRYEDKVKKTILTASILILLTVVTASAGDISLVSVRNKDFQVIKVINDQKSLQQFEKAWKEKKKTKNPSHPNWLFKIDIEGKGHGDRWLYDPSGLVQVLSKIRTRIYEISDAESFNKLIGTHNQPHEPLR